MKRQVALLRGINVGTAKRIAMADLRACFEALGYERVRTVLQSGNVVFDAKSTVTAAALEDDIAAATGVRAGVVVLSADRLREVAAGNPLREVAVDPSRALVYFLDAVPDDTGSGRPSDDALLPERLAFGPHAIYQWCPDGIMSSRVPARFFTSLGTVATGRNLRTVDKLVALLDA